MTKPEYDTVQAVQNSLELAEIAFEKGEQRLAKNCTIGALSQLADHCGATERPLER